MSLGVSLNLVACEGLKAPAEVDVLKQMAI